MNKKQIVSMWLGIIVFVLMGLFPPWIIDVPWNAKPGPFAGGRIDFEYGFIISHSLQLPTSSNIENNFEKKSETHTDIVLDIRHRIDFPTLIIQWLIVGAITIGLVLTFRDRKQQ